MFVVTAGRGASAPDDVFLTRTVARDLHVHVGEELRLTAPMRGTFRVAGVGEEAAQFGESQIVLPPTSVWKPRLPGGLVSWLVEKPAGISTAALRQLSEQSQRTSSSPWAFWVSPRFVPVDNSFTAADADTRVRWSWVFGAVALTVTGIVIAAAFAVGARRQLATLGLLSSNGASPRVLYLVLVLQGMWTGLVGAVLGVGLGAGVLVVLRPHIEELFGHVSGNYVFRGTDLFPILVLGVVAATVAAAVPARTATRVPVLAALAGRRPLGRVPAWLPIAGVVSVVVGLATLARAVDDSHHSVEGGNMHLLMAVAGCVLVLLGGCGVAAGLVGLLEPSATRSVGAVRVATRSLARQRTRTAAVVSAVAATGALAIAGSALVLGQHTAHLHKASFIAPDEVAVSGEYVADGSLPPSAALVAKVERVLPGAERTTTRVVADKDKLTWSVDSMTPAGDFQWGSYQGAGAIRAPSITIADPATIALWGLSDADQRALARNGWLVFGQSRGQITFTVGTLGHTNQTVTMGRPIERVHAELLSGLDHQTEPAVVVTPAKAAHLGFEPRLSSVVL
jgi:putative ABC transport system permease protein